MKITTETGSYYEIGESFWSKNGGGGEPLHWAYSVPDIDFTSWESVRAAHHGRVIEVGERLYIGSRDVWWLSTKIVSIEDAE